jgi:hypothetical protein
LSVPSSNIMMKLVLWPVVDSVPARVNVLYLQYVRSTPCQPQKPLPHPRLSPNKPNSKPHG